MAKRGPKPAPAAQKTARGTDQPCRTLENVVDFPTVDACPPAPEFLTEHAREFWNRIAPQLHAQRVLTVVDLPALEHLAILHGEIRDQVDRRVQPTAADRTQLRLYLAEFGLTPSSRTRVPRGGGGDDGNKFGANGRRKKPA